MKNYYEILEVSTNASKEVIDKAYRVLAKKYHPDTTPSKETKKLYEDVMKEITEAYNILSNPILRQKYDIEMELENNKASINNYEQEEKQRRTIKSSIREKIDSNPTLSLPKTLFSSITQTIYNETKKDPKERAKDFKAIGLTIIVVGILIFIGWKIPFIRNFFSS